MGRHESLSTLFQRLRIDTSRPGFYDDAAFRKWEDQDPTFLDKYAELVRTQRYSDVYLKKARKVTRRTARFLYERIKEDGRLGACIDASVVLVRFLERQGVWSYAVKGAMSLSFSATTGLTSVHLAPIVMPGNPAKAAHMWVYAPPFEVVDVTVQRQPYSQGEEAHLAKIVLAEQLIETEFDVLDFMDVDAVEHFVRVQGRPPTLEDVEAIMPGLQAHKTALGAGVVELPQATVKYFPFAVSVTDEPLEDYRALCLSGKHAAELWREFSGVNCDAG